WAHTVYGEELAAARRKTRETKAKVDNELLGGDPEALRRSTLNSLVPLKKKSIVSHGAGSEDVQKKSVVLHGAGSEDVQDPLLPPLRQVRHIKSISKRARVRHIKSISKRARVAAERLDADFGGLLSEHAKREAFTLLVDHLTVDVMGLVSAFQLRGEGPGAFKEGSEEAALLKLHLENNHQRDLYRMSPETEAALLKLHLKNNHQRDLYRMSPETEAALLKLHLKNNQLREVLVAAAPGISLAGLAAATAPLLGAWVDNSRRTILRWLAASVAQEKWEPAGGEDSQGYSVSLVDIFSSLEAAAQTFSRLKMGAVASVRALFLSMLSEVVQEYIHAMQAIASMEEDLRAAKAAKIASKEEDLRAAKAAKNARAAAVMGIERRGGGLGVRALRP
ncbi:hypothetical protein T484DRAFT_1765497, partial [Baffinella frigidus]